MKKLLPICAVAVLTLTALAQIDPNTNFFLEVEARLIARELKDGKLFIVFRREYPSNHTYLLYSPSPIPPTVEVWRDVYSVSNGAIVLWKTESAKVTPAKITSVTVPEKLEWPK